MGIRDPVTPGTSSDCCVAGEACAVPRAMSGAFKVTVLFAKKNPLLATEMLRLAVIVTGPTNCVVPPKVNASSPVAP